MLTLYIMKTHHKEKNIADLYYTLSGLWSEGMIVSNVKEINKDEKSTDWYIVFFDHEKISFELKDAVEIMMNADPKIDVFIFMEKNGEVITQSPRMFRNHVLLQKDSFLPIDNGYKYERILDGWVKKIGV